MQLLIFCLTAVGLYTLACYATPVVYRPAEKALRKRSAIKLSGNDVLIYSLADRIEPYIHIDAIVRQRFLAELRSIGLTVKPETFRARAIAKGILYAAPLLSLAAISPLFLLATAYLGYVFYSGEEKKLKKQIIQRKESIERELPQFAGTIRQSLNSTRSIITIFEAYRKVCGTALRSEIEITLNDLKTGNEERALKGLESRVGSSKFSELVRGLIGMNKGDDVKIYFDMLALEYTKAQNEAVKKELLKRPSKLMPYMAALFVCLFSMTMLALFMLITSNLSTLF